MDLEKVAAATTLRRVQGPGQAGSQGFIHELAQPMTGSEFAEALGWSWRHPWVPWIIELVTVRSGYAGPRFSSSSGPALGSPSGL